MVINRQIRLNILNIILSINYISTSYSQRGGKHIQAIVTTWLFKSIENELNYPYIFDTFFVFLFVKVFDAVRIWKPYEKTQIPHVHHKENEYNAILKKKKNPESIKSTRTYCYLNLPAKNVLKIMFPYLKSISTLSDIDRKQFNCFFIQ